MTARRHSPWVLGMLTVSMVAGSWGVGASAAFGVGEPTTTPTITAPTDASPAAGDVQISATSTAPLVQFYVDAAALGTPVAVASGTGSTVWSTYGLANGISHALTAADCNENGCNATQSPVVTVTVSNTAPTITSPVNGATTDRTLTVNATAPGGGVAFAVDNASAGFDGSAPYSFVIAGPLAEGAHSASVQECNTAGTTCNGPTASVSFTVAALHPGITSVAPNPFSPNNDGFRDKTTFRVHLNDFENASFAIQNANGQTIKGPYALGRLSPGSHTYGWNGKGNGGKTASSGTYTIAVNTSAIRNDATLHGVTKAAVKLDLVAPFLSDVTGNGASFYPSPDGFQDTFHTSVRDNEGGGLWLKIYNTRGAEIRQYSHGHSGPGTFQFAWNGRDAHGSLMRAGTYRFLFAASDPAGNRRASRSYHVTVRPEHLVNKTAVLSLDGDAAGPIVTSDTACTQYSYSLSKYVDGVWLDNACDPYFDGTQVIAADYTFRVPAAVRYNTIRIGSFGSTIFPPEEIAAIIYNFSASQWDPAGVVSLANESDTTSTYKTVSAAGHVSSGHTVTISIGVDNEAAEDYDIGAVAIRVTYAVLTR